MALVHSTLQEVPELLAGRGLAPQVLQVLDHERPFVFRQSTTEAVEAVTPDGIDHLPGEIEGRTEGGLNPALAGHAAQECGLARTRAAPDCDRCRGRLRECGAKRRCELVSGRHWRNESSSTSQRTYPVRSPPNPPGCGH